MSEDPLGLFAGDINIYRYTENSPNRFTDPNGMLIVDTTGGKARSAAYSTETGTQIWNSIDSNADITVFVTDGNTDGYGHTQQLTRNTFEVVLNPNQNGETYTTTLPHELTHVNDKYVNPYADYDTFLEPRAGKTEAKISVEKKRNFAGTGCPYAKKK